MKTIIAGGRDQRLTKARLDILFDFLDDITEVVSGCASGIDSDAIDWAKQHNIPYKEFPANWNNYKSGEFEGWIKIPTDGWHPYSHPSI